MTLTTAGAGFDALAQVLTIVQAVFVLLGLVVLAMALPWPRRFISRRAWCVIARHRIRRVCFETRMHTRSGRLPLVLWITPTEVGERALVWCRAGICFEEFEQHTSEIAPACYAREARMAKSKRWAQLVTLHVVRREFLPTGFVISDQSPGLDVEGEIFYSELVSVRDLPAQSPPAPP
ncbi:MAG: hypothetical protein ACM3ML_36650 [Micromonosporaceae bacterium]